MQIHKLTSIHPRMLKELEDVFVDWSGPISVILDTKLRIFI